MEKINLQAIANLTAIPVIEALIEAHERKIDYLRGFPYNIGFQLDSKVEERYLTGLKDSLKQLKKKA